MMTSGITIKDNVVINHNDMNGSGALLYDVQRAALAFNTMKNNRTAIALQKSAEVQIMHNNFQMNQTAIKGTKVDDQTVVYNNQFTGNILTARSDQQGIQLSSNYYDDYVGTDLKNDGTGDVPYVAVSSFGQWMKGQPVYQYFVESPSVVLLTSLDQQINKSARTVLVDQSTRN
ncbi:Copper-binding protein OS=Lysinibacillus sphaericus OX=1421 GN=LS41612_03005 PE=4 SV=1 [Lysinibacillus sphaericus]